MNYLGVAVAGLPNLIILNGPGSPTVLSNMALGSEQQGEYALRMIDFFGDNRYTSIEARDDAVREWTDHVTSRAALTLFENAESWFAGANIAGKPSAFLPYIGRFRPYNVTCDAVAAAGHEGVILREPVPSGAVADHSRKA